MNDTKRTAADIGVLTYHRDLRTLEVQCPEAFEPDDVFVRGTDALALRDRLTAAEAEVERLRKLVSEANDVIAEFAPGFTALRDQMESEVYGVRTDGN